MNQKYNLSFRASVGFTPSEDQAIYLTPNSTPGLGQQLRTIQGKKSTDSWFMLLNFSSTDALGAQFIFSGCICSQQELKGIFSLGPSIWRAVSNREKEEK